jgi:two-component system alkaline phosphatase synthesis response regulator PhoP
MAQRILVVDDDRAIVRLVRAYLEQSGYQVLVAYDGDEALRSLRSDRPDLMVLDLMMPKRDGWEVTRIVRGDESLAKVPIVMLTARVEDQDKIVGLELGADDYVAKPFNPREVVARVRSVLRRTQAGPLRSRVIQAGPLVIDLDKHLVEAEGQALRLTPTEFELLRVLAEHPDRALTRSELIELALGYQYDGLDRTVDSHIKNLRHKLQDVGVSANWLETEFGVGYRWRSVLASADGGAA